MALMKGDIVNRVKRFPKPSQASEALQPLFEAVSNALHACEDLFAEKFQEKGRITVTVCNIGSPDLIEIIVKDNGTGLDDKRFDAFCTTDTDCKISRGGKGIGRLLWLDAFKTVEIKSVYRHDERLFRRSFSFRLDNSSPITDEEINHLKTGLGETGTVVVFKGLSHKAYKKHFPVRGDTIIKHLGSHFFADFILGKSPYVSVDISDGISATFPQEIQQLKVDDRGVSFVEGELFGKLSLTNFVCNKKASASFDGQHHLHFVANGRTVISRKIDGLLGIGTFGSNGDNVYHGCVMGDFLDENVNQERTHFNFDENTMNQMAKVCADHIRTDAISEEVKVFDAQRLDDMQDFIRKYPSYGFEDTKELLNRVPRNAVKPEQFAQALVPIRIRRDEERNKNIQEIVRQLGGGKDNRPEDFNEKIKKAADEIHAEEQRQLTEYILRRKTVLDVMDGLIRCIREREEGIYDFHPEETLHQFICPMRLRGDDPLKVEQSEHDLWIIDERLTFTKYFASDVPFSKILKDEKGKERPDLLIYDRIHGLGIEGEEPLRQVMLVEFKKPGRKQYDDNYSPQNQISRYLTKLKNGDIMDFRNSRVRVTEDCVFYCYVIADIVGDLETNTNSWATTANGRGKFQPLSGKFKGVIEIIEWRDLLSDARLRNLAFLDAAGLYK